MKDKGNTLFVLMKSKKSVGIGQTYYLIKLGRIHALNDKGNTLLRSKIELEVGQTYYLIKLGRINALDDKGNTLLRSKIELEDGQSCYLKKLDRIHTLKDKGNKLFVLMISKKSVGNRANLLPYKVRQNTCIIEQ